MLGLHPGHQEKGGGCQGSGSGLLSGRDPRHRRHETLCELGGPGRRHSRGGAGLGRALNPAAGRVGEAELQATMHSSCGLWALLLPPPLLLLLLLVTTSPSTALKEDEKQLMVQLHNLYRAQVSPPASDMRQMVSTCRSPKQPQYTDGETEA